ncbi:uncharacterized protein [Venturia canescens]|uniref:uncharacterized protein isoform X1 n=1 Tax=Venturia canescens TaxID=32260 RepID=UPI001C9C98EB|nr:uncharacterized protein LOC122418000 isoform X1 [Venturia canescens]
MEASELYNLSISPVVTGSFVLAWSEDNHISLITHRGVHVFDFVPHPTCMYPFLRLARSFIYPSDYLPTKSYASIVTENLRRMKHNEIYELFLEEALTPDLEDKTKPIPRIINVAWSPMSLAKPGKCLCVIITLHGSVEILNKLGNDWLSMWNLTERWKKLVEAESKIDPVILAAEIEQEIMWADHLRRFLGTTATWSSIFQDRDKKNFAWLAVAFRSSEIVVAKVREVDELAERSEEPRIVYKRWLEAKVRIDQLLWITLKQQKSHVIIVAYGDGRIHGLILDEIEGKLEENRLLKYEVCSDFVKITSVQLFAKVDGNHVVLLTKSSCLIALSLNHNGECYQRRYLRINGFSITGLTIVSREKVVVTTQNSKLFAVTIPKEDNLSCEAVSHDLKSNRVQYLGLVSSRNSTILLSVTSPDCIFDHLINREPSVLQVFRLSNEEWNPWRLIQNQLHLKAPIRNYWDCLESLRIIAAKNGFEPAKIFPKIETNFDSLDVHELRIVMWLTSMLEILEKRQFLKSVGKIVGHISEAEPLIFLLSGCDFLNRLIKKGFSCLNENEKRSASFLRMYMEMFLAGEEGDETNSGGTIKKILHGFRASENLIGSVETETCNLCGVILTELPWTIESCPSGHKLPRCSLSLLQITHINFRSCPVCTRLYHTFLDQIYPQVRCIYCDVPPIYDYRMQSSALDEMETKWNNLSKHPVGNIEHTKNPAGSQESTSEKVKKRSVNDTQTFAVIINRDQHDDSLITETWQQF